MRAPAGRARAARLHLCGLGLLLALAGCAALEPLVPQTVALRSDWPQGVARRVDLAAVPFVPQEDYQCGPAALAMALAHAGADVPLPTLVRDVWVPARQGSLQAEMLAAARRHGRISHRLPASYADLLREVAAGHPVVVLQDVGPLWPQWHYAVVTGFDHATGSVFLHSGTTPRLEMSFTAFERSWMPGGRWAMVVLPPGRIAASADEASWQASVLAFARVAPEPEARSAYSALLQRWPDNLPAATGLANLLHARGALGDAAQVLQSALERAPNSVVLMNNLALVLSDQGRHAEALALTRRALVLESPFDAELLATRAQILQRLGLPAPRAPAH